jgi:hypothetical protein
MCRREKDQGLAITTYEGSYMFLVRVWEGGI